MTALELRSEIIGLVRETKDVDLLTWLRNMLRDNARHGTMDAEMLEMAVRSEEAIKRGEVYTHDEALAYLKHERRRREAK